VAHLARWVYLASACWAGSPRRCSTSSTDRRSPFG
jgi:hypothetical protein